MNSRLSRFRAPARSRGFTLMEIIVVLGIIIILSAVLIPCYTFYRTNANRAVALSRLHDLASAASAYASQNGGVLPNEDADGPNSWSAAAAPENKGVWYNALPRMLGAKGAGDYADNPRGFYRRDNLLYLPGAGYQATDAKLTHPQFAMAMNSRLQRKKDDGSKEALRLASIVEPSRTVLFFEQGVKGEKKSSAVQSKYDGAPKGTAESFVARYGRVGVVAFVDGHAEMFEPSDLLSASGELPYPQTDVIWTVNPADDPN